MSLDKYNGDKKLIDRISGTIRDGKISHAYIFEGDSCVDKMDFAKEFFKAVICKVRPGYGCDNCPDCRKFDHGNYEDLYIVEGDSKSLKNENIIKLQENLKRKPIGSRNLVIIKDADTMTIRAQNRFLKSLEEPSTGTIIVLLSENKEYLLETIRSRCICYRIASIDQFENQWITAAEQIIDLVLNRASFHEKKKVLGSIVKSRKDALCLLDGLERQYRDILIKKASSWKLFKSEDVFKAIELIEEARRDLIINVNYNYAMKNLLIKIGG